MKYIKSVNGMQSGGRLFMEKYRYQGFLTNESCGINVGHKRLTDSFSWSSSLTYFWQRTKIALLMLWMPFTS